MGVSGQALEKVEAWWDFSRSCRSLVVRFRVRAMSPKPRWKKPLWMQHNPGQGQAAQNPHHI